jgi:phage tail sheath gpL-like
MTSKEELVEQPMAVKDDESDRYWTCTLCQKIKPKAQFSSKDWMAKTASTQKEETMEDNHNKKKIVCSACKEAQHYQCCMR